MATKKRNPNDTTFRNITALKKRVTKLEAAAWLPPEILKQLHQLDRRVAKLERKG